jgi:hypothetical protein
MLLPRPRVFPRLIPRRLPREKKVTIAIHLMAGGGSLITAADTQETYNTGAKVDAGKIAGAWRGVPLGAINVTGAGDSEYIDALTQEIIRQFQNFTGTPEELEKSIRRVVRIFYKVHVMPFVGKFDDENVPDYRLLIAIRHEGTRKLWTVNKALMTEDNSFGCVGIGKATAQTLLSRLFPLYPSLDSVAVLAAYVIYRVKSTVDGCGLKTEIRFIHRGMPGIVPDDRIGRWENLFRKYNLLERDLLYQAMNFTLKPPAPLPFDKLVPAQMRPLTDILKHAEEMREEFSKAIILDSPSTPGAPGPQGP